MLMILSTEARNQDAITVHSDHRLPPEEPEIRMVMDLVRKGFSIDYSGSHIATHCDQVALSQGEYLSL